MIFLMNVLQRKFHAMLFCSIYMDRVNEFMQKCHVYETNWFLVLPWLGLRSEFLWPLFFLLFVQAFGSQPKVLMLSNILTVFFKNGDSIL